MDVFPHHMSLVWIVDWIKNWNTMAIYTLCFFRLVNDIINISRLISWNIYSYLWGSWLLLTRKNDSEWHVPKIAYYVDMTKLLYTNRRTIFHKRRQANYVDLINSRWLILFYLHFNKSYVLSSFHSYFKSNNFKVDWKRRVGIIYTSHIFLRIIVLSILLLDRKERLVIGSREV